MLLFFCNFLFWKKWKKKSHANSYFFFVDDSIMIMNRMLIFNFFLFSPYKKAMKKIPQNIIGCLDFFSQKKEFFEWFFCIIVVMLLSSNVYSFLFTFCQNSIEIGQYSYVAIWMSTNVVFTVIHYYYYFCFHITNI